MIVSYVLAIPLIADAPHAQPAAHAGPLSLVLLLDASFSMTPFALADDERFPALLSALDRELASDDAAAVGCVTDRTVVSPFVPRGSLLDEWKLLAQAPPAERFGPSPLWDALDAAVSAVATRDGTRSVVLWTDGQPTGNKLGLDEVTARARAAGVSLYAIVDDRAPVELLGGARMGIDKPCAVFEGIEQTGGGCTLNRRAARAPTPELRVILQTLHERGAGQEQERPPGVSRHGPSNLLPGALF